MKFVYYMQIGNKFRMYSLFKLDRNQVKGFLFFLFLQLHSNKIKQLFYRYDLNVR